MARPNTGPVIPLAVAIGAICMAACGSRTGLTDFDESNVDAGAATPQSCPAPSAGTLTIATTSLWWSVVADATDAYATSTGVDGGGGGSLWRIPLCGGPPVVLGPADSSSIGLDATSVYWVGHAGQYACTAAVNKADKATGSAVVLATLPFGISSLAVGPDGIYGTSACCDVPCQPNVFRLPLDGGAVTVLANQNDPFSLTLDATSLYWLSRDGLMKMPLGGGPVTTLTSDTRLLPGPGVIPQPPLFVQGSMLYWVSPYGSVLSLSVDGGTPSPLLEGQQPTAGIAVDATNLYANVGGVLESVPLGGGPPVTLGSVGTRSTMVPMAVNGTSLFFAAGQTVAGGDSLQELTPK